MKKRILSFLLATVILVTPVFKPADMSFLNNIRNAGQTIGHTIGQKIIVNIDVSDILNKRYKF